MEYKDIFIQAGIILVVIAALWLFFKVISKVIWKLRYIIIALPVVLLAIPSSRQWIFSFFQQNSFENIWIWILSFFEQNGFENIRIW